MIMHCLRQTVNMVLFHTGTWKAVGVSDYRQIFGQTHLAIYRSSRFCFASRNTRCCFLTEKWNSWLSQVQTQHLQRVPSLENHHIFHERIHALSMAIASARGPFGQVASAWRGAWLLLDAELWPQRLDSGWQHLGRRQEVLTQEAVNQQTIRNHRKIIGTWWFNGIL